MGRVRFVVCLGALAAISLVGITGANAMADDPPAEGLDCSFDPATRTLTVTVGLGVDHGGRVQRLGDEIVTVFELTFFKKDRKGRLRMHRRVEVDRCAGEPTVHNTDTIRLLAVAEEDTDFDISLEGGPFAPGATPESDGTSEIEISVDRLAPGFSLGFVGRPEPDWFRYGSHQGVPGVNLNAQDESDAPDVDATLNLDPTLDANLNGGDWPVLSARTGSGDDTVTSTGGPEFDASFGGAVSVNGGAGNDTVISNSPRFTFIKGATGNDFIQGDGLRNVVFGGGGADTIITGPQGDDVEPGKGPDVATLNGGVDIVATKDRAKDRIRCGPNRDFVSKDRKDRTPGCERKSFEPLHLKPFDH
jgi:hypothetical protein